MATSELDDVLGQAGPFVNKPQETKAAPAKAPAAKAPAAKAPAAKAPAAKAAPAKAKSGTAADGSRRGQRNGTYTEAVEAAYGKIKGLKSGTALSTRELSEKYEDLDLRPWAFKAAALRFGKEGGCKVVNKDRLNIVTRT